MQEQVHSENGAAYEWPAVPTEIGDWRSIGSIAQGMILAWDERDEREHVAELVEWTTERQRARIWQEMWRRGSEKWRKWAVEWLLKDAGR